MINCIPSETLYFFHFQEMVVNSGKKCFDILSIFDWDILCTHLYSCCIFSTYLYGYITDTNQNEYSKWINPTNTSTWDYQFLSLDLESKTNPQIENDKGWNSSIFSPFLLSVAYAKDRIFMKWMSIHLQFSEEQLQWSIYPLIHTKSPLIHMDVS